MSVFLCLSTFCSEICFCNCPIFSCAVASCCLNSSVLVGTALTALLAVDWTVAAAPAAALETVSVTFRDRSDGSSDLSAVVDGVNDSMDGDACEGVLSLCDTPLACCLEGVDTEAPSAGRKFTRIFLSCMDDLLVCSMVCHYIMYEFPCILA